RESLRPAAGEGHCAALSVDWPEPFGLILMAQDYEPQSRKTPFARLSQLERDGVEPSVPRQQRAQSARPKMTQVRRNPATELSTISRGGVAHESAIGSGCQRVRVTAGGAAHQ